MSYILEALRKADAERERGSVPDLHAQLLPPGAAHARAEPARAPLLPWLAVGALLAIVAGGAWFMLGREAPVAAALLPPVMPSAVPSVTPSVTPPVAPSAALAAAQPSMPATASAAASAAAAVATLPAVPAATPVPEPAVLPPPPSRPGPAARRPAASSQADAASAALRVNPPPRAAATKPVPRPEAAAARLPSLAELPGELRQQVPPLTIGGSVYSPQASARMVVVNGQVFQEGSHLAPELKLEQVRQKAAVFSIRGQLFEVPF